MMDQNYVMHICDVEGKWYLNENLNSVERVCIHSPSCLPKAELSRTTFQWPCQAFYNAVHQLWTAWNYEEDFGLDFD